MLIVDSSIVLYVLCTTSNVHVCIVRHCVVVEEFLLPVNIWITLAHEHTSLWVNASCWSIVVVHEVGRADVSPACRLKTELVLHSLVDIVESVSRTIGLRELRNELHS